MKQNFTQEDFFLFQKYFHIKKHPGKWDTIYLEKTQKYARFFSKIPGVLFLGVGNSTSMNAGNKESDIDLFVITKKNSMWFVRILLTCFSQILGVRKTHKYHEGRFCLSFFCEEDLVDFSHFAVENDIYLYFWIVYLKPIINYNQTYEKFLGSQSWAHFGEYKNILETNKKYIIKEKNISEKNNTYIEQFNIIFKKIFLPKTLKTHEKIGKPYGIIIHDGMLKFHNNDIRKGLYKKITNG